MKFMIELEADLELKQAVIKAIQRAQTKPAEPVQKTVAPIETVEEPVSQAEPEPVEEVKTQAKAKVEQVKEFTPDEMRRAFMAKNNPENRPKLKAILDAFGTSNITGLEPKHYSAAMEKLEAL